MITKQRLGNIKVISFDGDMTLWDFYSVMRHALQFTLGELRKRYPGPSTDMLTINIMIDIRNRIAAEYKGKGSNLEHIRYQAFSRTLHYIGVNDDSFAAALNTLYLKHRFEDIELYPDVVPTLRTLGQYYQLGLLSNGNSYPDLCGLSDTFAFTVFAQGVGVEKPDKKMFLEACRQAGCTPGNMMHIGDSLTADVFGAKQVGTIAAWLNRNQLPNDSDITADFEIHTLTELTGLLGIDKP